MQTRLLLLSAAIGLSFVGAANAVHLDPSGRGQVLTYPYYTVNNHQQTLLSVTNTSSAGQALKVRFHEGYNSRDVIDFNLWLPAYDVWTATVFALADAGLPGDGAAILSRDRSCTSPQFPESGTTLADGTAYVSFVNFAFSLANRDGGPTATSRTREGWVEIIAMTDVAEPLLAAITHTSNGTPANCLAVRPNTIIGNPAVSNRPSGGLIGTASIINVGQGTLLATRAEALGGFTNVPLFTGTANVLPNLGGVNDTVLGGPATAHRFDNDGRALTLTYGGPGVTTSRPVDAVSAVLMADQIYNEYVVSPALDAASDWVLTFPTKHFYTDQIFAGAHARPPFEDLFSGGADGQAFVSLDATLYDRNQRSPEHGDCFPEYCGIASSAGYAVNVARIGVDAYDTDGVLGSRLKAPIPQQGSPFGFLDVSNGEGWIWMSMGPRSQVPAMAASVEGKVLHGLPVIGFWATNLVNNSVGDGVLSNYSAAVRHATSVTCKKASDGTVCE